MTDPTAPNIETRLKITAASQIKSRRQRWFWAPDGSGIIPLGVGTMFAGNGGEGKTTFAQRLAADLTRGELEGDLAGVVGSVLFLGPEDDWATVTIPRLKGAGADLDRVFQVQVETWTDFTTMERELKFPLDVAMLRDAVEQTDARMIVIDPAPSLMDGDMNKVQDVRRSYEPLMALAQQKDLAVILINHFGKGAGSVRNKLSGSHAWRDLTRSYLAFALDPETGERVLSQDKNNYGTGLKSYTFDLESVTVQTDDGETAEVGRARFLGLSDVSVNDIINREAASDDDAEDRNAAQVFILDYLRGCQAQEASAGDVIKAGIAAGFSKDEIKHARKRSCDPQIVTAKSKFKAGWIWQIDPEDVEGATGTPEGAQGAEGASTREGTAPSAPSVEGATKEPGVHVLAPSAPSSGCPHGFDPDGCIRCQAERIGAA